MRSLPLILIAAFAAAACLFVCPTAAPAQLNQGTAGIAYADLFPGARFDPAIPDLAAFAGILPGQRPLHGDEVLAYFTRLAELSPRAELHTYSASHHGRPLVWLAVSEEATIADLEGFRREHGRRLDPREGGTPGRDALADAKAVAYMAYGIHGDELSSTDAAAALAYWLVAGEDDHAARLRRSLVVLIDPNENPDGRARYLAQIGGFAHRRANPDPDDLAHASVWPWGRGNHYLFDLNRDWFSLVHPESRRSVEIVRWLPQLMVDSHEMWSDATYLFPPPRHPFNPHVPTSARAWEVPFADDQARALDARGYPYFSGEWNEEFFPGYGSSYAKYMGTVGILYEMSRTSGTLVSKRDGTVRTFAQAVEHQVASSVANLTSLAENAPAVLADMIAARAAAIDEGRRGEVRAWVLPRDPRDPTRTERLADLLAGQGIEAHRLAGEVREVSGLRDITTGRTVKLGLPAGSLLVRLDQPQGRLARVLLDPHVPMSTEFFQDEREYLEKGKGTRLYDTTAWSLPLLRGLAAYWTDRAPGGDWRPWQPAAPAEAPAALTDRYATAIAAGDDDLAPTLLARLLQEGITVRVARKDVTIGGRSFRAGALVVRREGNLPDLTERLRRIQADLGAEFWPVETSRAERGPDLGGDEYPVLVAPRVGVLTGSPISPTAYGWIWHLLDQDLDLRFNALDIGSFDRLDLSRYNVLVFPPAGRGANLYRQLLGERGLARLRDWIEAGGTAIGIGGGARLLADPALELTRTRLRADALDTLPPPVWSIAAEEAELAGRLGATGLRTEAPREPDGDRKIAPAVHHGSLYDVAPIVGAGALPFSKGHAQGQALVTRPLSIEQWLQPVLAPGKTRPDSADLRAVDDRLRRFMPRGSLLAADLDPEFWLNFGLPPRVTVWLGSDDTFVARPPVEVAARFADLGELHRGGLLWPEAAARIAHTAYATREAVGRGQLILFADHPTYRRWMAESERMFVNALLLGPGLGARWPAAW